MSANKQSKNMKGVGEERLLQAFRSFRFMGALAFLGPRWTRSLSTLVAALFHSVDRKRTQIVGRLQLDALSSLLYFVLCSGNTEKKVAAPNSESV